MNKLFFVLLFIALAAHGQQTSVAVLPSDGTVLGNDELEALTDKMRESALKVLPTNAFVLLKQDVVVRRLGGAEKYIKECSESSCIVDLGKKAQVDYVAQASVGKLGSKIRFKVELYNVSTEGLVGMLSDEADNVSGLLAIVERRVPAEVFGKIPGASGGSKAAPVSVEGGISGVQSTGGDYEFEGGKSYLASIATEPEGAVVSFNGVPDSRCTKTPCKLVLGEGNVRIVAALDQYERADTTIFIKQNNQNISIRLKANFGVLEIKPAYLEGIGKDEQWILFINGKAASSWENRLSPGKYKVELSHRCYEALSFDAGINKDKREVFDISAYIKLKKGGLVLNAERNGEPVSEPVFVNGKQAGETPFSDAVPLCAEIEIGKNRKKVDVKLKHNEKVEHTVKSSGGYLTDSRDGKSYMSYRKSDWAGGMIPCLGGGVSFNMKEIEPNYFNSLGGQWNIINIELYKKNLKFLRFGMNIDWGNVGLDRDAIRRMQDVQATVRANHFKVHAFTRLYPVNFLFLSGGAGLDYYSLAPKGTDFEVEILTPVFPVGGGIFLGSRSGVDVKGIVIEGSYNIVPFKGRTAKYISINAGLKLGED